MEEKKDYKNLVLVGEEKEEELLHIWFNRMYWRESTDWSQHGDSLDNIHEIFEYIKWRNRVMHICDNLSELVDSRFWERLAAFQNYTTSQLA